MTEVQDNAIRSIVKQWNGGEHVLAGARASELVYGKAKKPNDDILVKLTNEAKGIERYITAPTDEPVTIVDDQGGNPMARQPENREEATGASNGSTDQAKDEQTEIDNALAAGRKAREEAGSTGEVGSTKLNPEGSDEEPKGKNSKPRAAKSKAEKPAKDEVKPTDNPSEHQAGADPVKPVENAA